jgi:hypothetical protein
MEALRRFAFLTLTNVRLGAQDHLFLPDVSTMYGPNHVTYVDPEVRNDGLLIMTTSNLKTHLSRET